MTARDATPALRESRVAVSPRPRLRWRNIRGFFFILPWLVGFVLFTLGPFLGSLYLSFTSWRLVGPIQWVGLDNYVQLLTADARFAQSLVNTAAYTAVQTPGTLLLAFAAAALLNQPVRGVPIFRTMFYLPAITSGVATAVLWVWILHPTGLLNTALGWLGVPGPNWLNSTRWALPGLILMSLWNIGTPMILFLAGLQGIPQHLYEAAAIDGAGWWGRLRHVTLPMMTPTILLTLILGIIDSFQVFTASLVVTNGGPADATLFVLLYLYQQGFRFLRMGYAAAIAWVLFALILAFTLVQLGLARRWVYYEGELRRQ
jgi:multiple sugar transport system permease protein